MRVQSGVQMPDLRHDYAMDERDIVREAEGLRAELLILEVQLSGDLAPQERKMLADQAHELRFMLADDEAWGRPPAAA